MINGMVCEAVHRLGNKLSDQIELQKTRVGSCIALCMADILIISKVNQIGSVTEAIEACKISQEAGPEGFLAAHSKFGLICSIYILFSTAAALWPQFSRRKEDAASIAQAGVSWCLTALGRPRTPSSRIWWSPRSQLFVESSSTLKDLKLFGIVWYERHICIHLRDLMKRDLSCN